MALFLRNPIYSAMSAKKKLLTGAAIATILAVQANGAYAGCGADVANDDGGTDYTLTGDETTQCALTDNDTLNITDTSSISTNDNSVFIAGTGVSIANAGTIEGTANGFSVYVFNDEERAILASITMMVEKLPPIAVLALRLYMVR